jgi:hypothetical protein
LKLDGVGTNGTVSRLSERGDRAANVAAAGATIIEGALIRLVDGRGDVCLLKSVAVELHCHC